MAPLLIGSVLGGVPTHDFRHEVILRDDGADGFVRQTMRLSGDALERTEARPFDGRLAEPPATAGELPFGEADLSEVRHSVSCWARLEGLDRAGTEDLVLAVDELATNSVRHGGGGGALRMWRDGRTLLCEVRDRGEMRDPLLGRIRPGAEAVCGRGMWIVNQLCDLVQIRSSSAGSQIRLHKRLG